MTITKKSYLRCKEPLKDSEISCPKCGSKDVSMVIQEFVSMWDLLAGKLKLLGKGKPINTFKFGWDWHRDSKSFRWIRQIVDRKNKLYQKLVITQGGEIIKNVNKPLPKHQGHGDAKKKKN